MLNREYMALIEKRMSEKRYLHSLNVAKEAARLSALYGADSAKAELAGLLYDITKETPPDEQLQIMRRSGIMLSVVEQNSQKSF